MSFVLRFAAVFAAAVFFVPAPAKAQVVLNEIAASNFTGLNDDDGDASDWLELLNTSGAPVDLTDFALTDDGTEPRKWVFPETTLEGGDYLLVWCSGKDRTTFDSDAITAAGSTIPFSPKFADLSSAWSYLSGAPDEEGPPADWNALDFDDSQWEIGQPAFGFDDEELASPIPEGSGALFLRRRFEVGAIPDNLVFSVRYDDGFVAYLNGTRIDADNFADDDEPTFASLARSSNSARRTVRFDWTEHLDLLREGENVLAIALLNRTVESGDMIIIPQLGTVPPVYHTNFQLSASGESVLLVSAAGRVEDAITYPEQFRDQSYGRSPNGTGEWKYFLEPSPLTANDGPSSTEPLVVSDTTFSFDRGFYEEPIDVEISSLTEGARIHFTLDGEEPTEDSALYEEPIRIESTTVLRARAFKDGFEPTNIDTQTYLFLDDVVRQDRRATLDAGFPSAWGGTAADYGMDPRVVGQDGQDRYQGRYAESIKDDLKSIRTISVVLPIADMFGPQGIYTNSGSRGSQWERAASAELIDPNDPEDGFQVHCGLRIQGGAFRSHGLTKKHSLRLAFRGIYGPTKLKYPIFGEDATDRFDTITLRANSNDGYQWAAAGASPLYIRDSFGRQTMLAMGGIASHETFVHVYINGFYWGLYNAVERPDNSFAATYFGGDKEEWDSSSNGTPTNGTLASWNQLLQLARGSSTEEGYQRMLGNFPDGTDDPDADNFLDVDNVADYMITNLWVGNTDWPHKNFWIGRRRGPESTGYKFFMWDSEWSMGIQSNVGTNQTNVANGVAEPYGRVRQNEEFRVLFGDKLHEYFFNGGPLYVDQSRPNWDPEHPERNVPAARFMELADTVERAMVAESARWGDQHGAIYTRDEHWMRERDNLLRTYFPRRSANVLSQFQTGRLYPRIVAPSFNQHGGRVPDGFLLVPRAPRGTIYYTTDGSDPRMRGGAVNPDALVAESGEQVTLLPSEALCRVFVPQDDSLGLDWTATDFNDADWTEGPTGVGYDTGDGYLDLIGVDLLESMREINSSAYVRLEFDVDNPSALIFPTLRMKYDDGFAAYLNGVFVFSRNAPEDLSWDSAASTSNSDSRAVQFEDFELSLEPGVLRAGRNVLAIHALNRRPGDNDFLMLPEFVATRSEGLGLVLTEDVTVRSRVFVEEDQWSALNKASFVVGPLPQLRVTELMYHPRAPEEGSSFGADDFEYMVLQNVGPEPVRLDGLRFSDGIRFEFANAGIDVLDPGAEMLIVENSRAFESRYGAGVSIDGDYAGNLGNGGELIRIEDSIGGTVFEFTFDDAWFPSTDGEGHSLVFVDAGLEPDAWNVRDNWRPSERVDGTIVGVEGGGWQRPGDSNQDARLNISDAVPFLLFLFGEEEMELPCDGADIADGGNVELLDMNGDADVNLSDAIHLLNYLFRGGLEPSLGLECRRMAGCEDVCAP